jgi:hypothetical protein
MGCIILPNRDDLQLTTTADDKSRIAANIGVTQSQTIAAQYLREIIGLRRNDQTNLA